MKNWIAVIALLVCEKLTAQEIVTHVIPDDGFVEVPLQFAFPYYGQLFTNSWMFDNGVVGFYSPLSGYNGGQNYFSYPFTPEMGGQFSYMIAPLWTDLDNYTGTFTTQGDASFQRYSWNNISQWGYPENLNSFSLEIFPSGSINVIYDQVTISGYPVSVGTTGDLTQSQFQQIFYALPEIPTYNVSNWNLYVQEQIDPCVEDPLSSTSCEGYAEEYIKSNMIDDIIENTEEINEEINEEIDEETIEEVIEDSMEFTEPVTEQLFSATETLTINSSLPNVEKLIKEDIDDKTTENNELQQTVISVNAQENTTLTQSLEIKSLANNTPVFANNNMQQMLTMGSSVTEILNNPVPDFSSFDIKPLSQQEQAQSNKIKNSLQSMNSSEIEERASDLAGSMDANDQAIAVQLIGYKAGFDQYSGTINDQSTWYKPSNVYNNNRLPQGSNLLFGTQDQKHQELMSLQYRR